MPKTAVKTAVKTTFEEIPIGSLAPHPRNARHNLGTTLEQEEMAASIREAGIIEPLVVAAPLQASWRYTVIAGHRRLNGAVDAKLDTVPCIIRHDLDTPEKQLETMLIENGHRKGLTVTEEADAYQALMEFPDYTPMLIAKKLGRTRTFVEGRLTLAHLPDKARDGVDRGQLTIVDALELASFTDLAVVEQLAEFVGTRDWQWKLNAAKTDRDAQAASAVVKAYADAHKVRFLTTADYDDAPDNVTDLGDLCDVLGIAEDLDGPLLEAALIAAHQDCPGHAVEAGFHGNRNFVCTNADILHRAGKQAPGAKSPADALAEATTAQAAHRKEQARAAQVLETAARVRHEHLRSVIVDGDDSLALTLMRAQLNAALARSFNDDGKKRVLGEKPAKTIAGMTLAQVVIALEIVAGLDRDAELNRTQMAWRQGWTKPWRHALGTTFGYEWSDAELKLMEDPS